VRGATAVLAAAAAFGAASVLARLAYGSGSEPLSLLGARLLLAALLLSALALWRPTPRERRRPAPAVRRSPARRELGVAVTAGLAFAGAGLGEFEALARATAPAVVLIVFVAPVWIALAGWVAGGEPPDRALGFALGGILAGLALLVATPSGPQPGLAPVALALGASVVSAVFFVALGELGRTLEPRLAACFAAWAATAAVLALDPDGVAAELARPQGARYGAAIGALTACALVLLAGGIRAGSPLTASAVVCAEPVVAAVLSWLLLDELLAPVQLAGGAVVLASVGALSVLSARAPPGCGATGRTTPPRPGSPRPRRPARSARRRRSAVRWRGSPE
jgi:drug/metabolite transporter (DMT)-like permease